MENNDLVAKSNSLKEFSSPFTVPAGKAVSSLPELSFLEWEEIKNVKFVTPI